MFIGLNCLKKFFNKLEGGILQKQLFHDILQNRCSSKFSKIHKKAPVPKSLFNKVADLTTETFFKERLPNRYFPLYFEKF